MSDQADKINKTDTSRVGQILLISLSVLIIIAALVWYETHLSTTLLKTILYVGVSGGVGGAAYDTIEGLFGELRDHVFKMGIVDYEASVTPPTSVKYRRLLSLPIEKRHGKK